MTIYYRYTVGLRFRPADIALLRVLSTTVSDEQERSAFQQAALAAEKGTPLVVQTMTVSELQQIIATFLLHGVRAPTIEPMRLTPPAGGMKLRAKARS